MIIEQWDKRKINSKTFAIPILTAVLSTRRSQNRDSKCLRINFLLIPLFYDH